MARLWYRPSAAEFVIGLGAETELLDATGASLVPPRMGRTAAVPLTSDSYSVYTAPDSGSVTTDLLDENSEPITQWTTSEEFATLGRGPAFQGPDGHEGDLYLSGDGVTFYRVTPDTGTVFGRLTALEEAPPSVSELGDLDDVDTDGATDGDTLRWNNSIGVWEPDSPAGTGTVTMVAGQSPDSNGEVTLTPGNIGAATASGLSALLTAALCMVQQDGPGYPAHTPGAQWKGYVGTVDPGPALKRVWFKPRTS